MDTLHHCPTPKDLAMNNAVLPTPVSAHYYIYGIPRVAACETLNDALLFCREAFDDPKLGTIGLEIRYTGHDLGGLTCKEVFDRTLSGHGQHCDRRIEPGLFPKCVTASYRSRTSHANRAFLTLVDALEFFDLGAGRPLEMARLRVHLTASDVWQIVPVTLYSAPQQAWDLAVDSVLHGRVLTDHSRLTRQSIAA
jgi:hypothetical protein